MAQTKPKAVKPKAARPRPAASADQDGPVGSNKAFLLGVLAVVVVGLAAVAFIASTAGDDPAGDTIDSAADGGSDAASDDSGTADTGTDTSDGDSTAAADAVDPGAETSAIEIVGDAIPSMPDRFSVSDAETDPFYGQVAPTLIGTDFDGAEVRIEPDGAAKAIYFVAHWCPHCQEEVPLIQSLIDEGAVPEGLEIYAVSTLVDSGSGNYPPSAWLSGEGFTPVQVRDTENSDAIRGFGGSSIPYVVYLDADHRLVARSSGNQSAETTRSLWETAVTAG